MDTLAICMVLNRRMVLDICIVLYICMVLYTCMVLAICLVPPRSGAGVVCAGAALHGSRMAKTVAHKVTC